MRAAPFLLLVGALPLLAPTVFSAPAAPPAWQSARTAPDDLAFTGAWTGVPAGATRYLSRAALAAVPGVKKIRQRLTPSLPEAELTVLPLPTLLAAHPLAGDADGLLLDCADRWQSVLPLAFVRSREPFILLYYDGRTPAEGWPRFSAVEAFAPYHVDVSQADHPGFDGIIAEGMISATQLVEVRAIHVARHYAPFYAGPLAALGEPAAAGRALFLRHCNNCHQGPGGVGGNTSQRPLAVLQAHAEFNGEFFRKIVRRPKDVYPDTVMPPHPQFDEAAFVALIAFLRETRAAEAPPAPKSP